MSAHRKQRDAGTPRAAWVNRVRALAALLVLACLSLGACDRPSARLIELSHVSRDDDSRSLSIAGRGFPGARAGEVQLRGTLYRAGEPPRALERTLPCHALSDELLRVDLSRDDDAPLESGLFEGRLEVHFPSHAGASEIVGSTAGVRLRFENARGADMASELLLSRRARAFQQGLGALEVEATPRGLVLLRVAENSQLARAGVAAGDRIVRLDGAPIERAQDLLPPHERSSHTLELARRLGGEKVHVVLAAVGGDAATQPGLVAFVFFVALLGGALVPASARVSEPPPKRRAQLAGIALTLAAFVAFGLPGFVLDIRLFFGLPMLVALTLLGVAFARRRIASVPCLHEVLRLSATTLALAGLTILSGSLTNSWLGASDLSSPVRWALLAAPPAWLALWVLHEARPVPTGAPYAAEMNAWLSWTTAICVVSLAAAGGTVPYGSPSWAVALPSALLVFVTKTALVTAVLRPSPRRLPHTWLAAAGLACPLLAWAWLAWARGAELALVLSAVGLGVWLTRLAQRFLQLRHDAPRDPALTPFL